MNRLTGGDGLKGCSFEGCGRKHFGKGLCQTHYAQQRAGKQLTPIKPAGAHHVGCVIPGCTNPHQAKGYCKKHYQTHVPLSERKRRHERGCKVEGCKGFHYAKGYCHKHHSKYCGPGQFRRHWDEMPVCAFKGCTRHVTVDGNIYCRIHTKKSGYSPYENGCILSKIGSNNPRWNGGASEYPNHALMKRVRRHVLEAANHECQVKGPNCKGTATIVHHKDNSRANHAVDNLIACCAKCHMGVLHVGKIGRPRTKERKVIPLKVKTERPVSRPTLNKYKKGGHVTERSLQKIKDWEYIEQWNHWPRVDNP
jgi:hypothetical protein